MVETEETFKRLSRFKKKITSLKYARRILNDEIRKLEEEITSSLSQYVSRDRDKFIEYEKKLRKIADEVEQDLE